MQRLYRHTQIGFLPLLVLSPILIYFIILTVAYDFNWFFLVTMLPVAAALAFFLTMTVQVTTEQVEVRFGPGVMRFTYPLDEVLDCRIVRNSLADLWGVRWIGTGMLLSISGLDAVEIELRNGSLVRIGTDQPQELAKAIEDALLAKKRH